jgi:capsid protein
MIRRWAALAIVLLGGGCARSVDDEILGVRAEIAHLQKTIPADRPIWISEGPENFDQFVEDFSERIPEYIYQHVVRKLDRMKTDEVDSLSQGDFNLAACEAEPAKFRGRFWRVSGVIAEIHTETPDDPGSPVRMVHAGVFFDDRMRPVMFHVVQKPEVLTLREDLVETRALFVKFIEYTTRSGRRVVAPFFIGKVLRRFL